MTVLERLDMRRYLRVQLLVSLVIIILSSTKFMELEAAISTIATMNLRNETDKVSLLAFKEGISNDPFGVLKSWNNSSHFCQWQGIICGRRHNSRVIALELRGKGLAGWISPFIGNLSFLRFIDLGNNNFQGRIPQEIGQLFRLRNLNLSYNSLGGEIPSNLSHCLDIRNLILSKNKLVGRIPAELASLSKLEDLSLATNNLTGSIPPSLGNLSSLKRISVGYNGLKGNIPYTISQLSNLEFFSIVANRFFGMLPSLLYNISSIHALSMASNRLQGNLPPDIGLSLPNLKYFLIAGNQFSGTIPNSFSNASKLQELDMANNSFVGEVPTSLGRLQSLNWLGLGANHLGSRKVNDLNFLTSLTNCTNLETLGIYDNLFGGVLPNSISNLTMLTVFALGRNQIYGTIPIGIGNLINLNTLGMEGNLLSGKIPSSLGKLQKLQKLTLQDNRLTGEIPYSLGNISQLLTLVLDNNHLEGAIPSTLSMCNKLELLSLSTNYLNGTIPKKVMGLSSLSIGLDISHNSLTGPLPSEVGNLKNLEYFDASHNKFTSEIPATLGSCLRLVSLYLADNFFVGNIPFMLSALRGISELDLSQNNLSGTIPKFLESFHLLKILNLSFNDLEGEVPKEGVFRNSSVVSVRGNAKLCGGIIELHLPRCNAMQSVKQGRHLSLKILIAIISVVACLFLISFVLVSCWIRRSKKKSPSTSSMEEKFAKIKLSYDALVKATAGFSTANLIGSGSFGHVYKGILNQDETVVAVKVFNLQQRGASKSFKAECKALRNIRHRNLVKILTSCSSIDSEGNDFKALVFVFMPNGSLEQWLHPRLDEHNQSRNLSLIQRLNIVVDVASALDYLHHHSHTRIIHCDLKPSNVLLDDDMTAHVGDFGLARLFSQSTQNSFSNQSSTIGMKGSIGYTAPEYGIGSEASTQGDVFSFGILLLEMLTGKRPTDEMFRDGLDLHIFAKMAIPERVMQIVDPGLLVVEELITEREDSSRRERHNQKRENMQNCIIQLTRIGVACSIEVPRDRMDMKDVTRELHLIRDTFLSSGNISTND